MCNNRAKATNMIPKLIRHEAMTCNFKKEKRI